MKQALGMLGLCARARRLITGEKAVIQAVRSGGACAVVLDEGASPNAKKAVGQACQTHDVALATLPAGALGDAIGRPGRMAAAITDAGMAGRVMALIEQARARTGGGDSAPEQEQTARSIARAREGV